MFNPNLLLTFANAKTTSLNGFILNGAFIPQEVLFKIFSYTEPELLLTCSLVCKNWCIVLRSYPFWNSMYSRKFGRPAKRLPWYLFYSLFAKNYFTNLLNNCNGEHGLKNWLTPNKERNKFVIEDPIKSSDPLPKNVSDFKGETSCFSAVQPPCRKSQFFNLRGNRLLKHIIKMYKPHISASEWVAAQFDSESYYTMGISLFSLQGRLTAVHERRFYVMEESAGNWEKVEMTVQSYSLPLTKINFEHLGMKMAGAVMKFDFESIEPRGSYDDCPNVYQFVIEYFGNGNIISKSVLY